MLRVLLLAAAPETVSLPAPPAGPLHFPSSPSCIWLLIWAALVAGVVFWLGRLLWRRLQRALARRQPEPAAPPAATRGRFGIGRAIAGILDRHLKAKSYRQGCHELSGALRTHWEERGIVRPAAARFTRMTAREMEERVGDRPETRLITVLSQLQFGRRHPTRSDFQGACQLAADLVSKRGAG